MTTQSAIATHLNIASELITEIQEWATVLWVRIKGIGCRFISKKVAAPVKKMESKLDRANAIVKELGFGKVWVGGKIVRVYFTGNSGYIELIKYSVDCSKMNHSPAFMAMRDAGLLQVTELGDGENIVETVPAWLKKGYESQLDYDQEDPNGMYYG